MAVLGNLEDWSWAALYACTTLAIIPKPLSSASLSPAKQEPLHPMNAINILLVEDDDHFAAMAEKSLTGFGYAVVRARNGREALAAYNPQLFDLVLTDLVMPDMDGVELIMTLRKAHPAVKIIAMTGGGRNRPQAYLNIAAKLGAMKTLEKPFSLEELQRTVTECMAS